MSIEQLMRITLAGIIMYVMLKIMGETESLKWMLGVMGLTVIALGVSKCIKKDL